MLRSSCEASLAQVTGMEAYSHVPISEAQKAVYVAQRETEGGLTDQRLLAQILCQTSPENVVEFWNAYPNIFVTEIEALEEKKAA